MNLYFILTILHDLFLITNALIILFCNDIFMLAITAAFLLIILLVNYLFKNCPITIIEQKYLSTSLFDWLYNITKDEKNNASRKYGSSNLTKNMLWIALLLICLKLTVIIGIVSLNKNFCSMSCNVIKNNDLKFIDKVNGNTTYDKISNIINNNIFGSFILLFQIVIAISIMIIYIYKKKEENTSDNIEK